LQAIWQPQRLRRGRLRLLDWTPLRILHPRFITREGVPDFRGAVLQFGDAVPVTGDIEVDVRAGGWRAHGHDRNPNFKNVILHVIWDEVGVHASACPPDSVGGTLKCELQPAPPALAIRNS